MPEELLDEFEDHDPRRMAGLHGRLAEFNRVGLLEAADLHIAQRVAALGGEPDEDVVLAVATAVRAVRIGSVCVDLAATAGEFPDQPWPDPSTWLRMVAASPLATQGALRIDRGLLYLDRYHRLERQLAGDVTRRASQAPPLVDEAALVAAAERVRSTHVSPEQEQAAQQATRQWTTVLTGGPGTGKTTTVARMLALVADQAAVAGRRAAIALAAPTGKAATRLQEAVAEQLAGLPESDRQNVGRPVALTLHRLLGWRPDNATRFRHDRAHPLAYDLVVVDEASMIDLTLMARLLEAVRLGTRLVLVGDPRQLTSVGAGAVLADLVAGYQGRADSPVVTLTHNFRSSDDIQALAEALRAGDADAVMTVLRTAGAEQIEFLETDDPAPVIHDDALATALDVHRAAEAGDAAAAVAALDRHRLLCAHRDGPYGVRHWNRQVERWLADEAGIESFDTWYVGRPLLVAANDYALGVYNGETGAVVRDATGARRAVIAGSGGLRDYAPGRLDAVETMHALTIHKSQGSQADRVTVLLPDESSRLLTRELFYTAVTRARSRVRVVGTEAAVRAAVAREAGRATGLRHRIAQDAARVSAGR